MFDNFEDYTIAELKKMLSNYRQYHNINVTKKKKADLVNLLNEKFVLKNNVLYMKLDDGEEFPDRTDSYLLKGNPELLTRQIPKRRKGEGPRKAKPSAKIPAKIPTRPSARQKKAVIREIQTDNILDEEPIEQPRVFKRLLKTNKKLTTENSR